MAESLIDDNTENEIFNDMQEESIVENELESLLIPEINVENIENTDEINMNVYGGNMGNIIEYINKNCHDIIQADSINDDLQTVNDSTMRHEKILHVETITDVATKKAHIGYKE